jgi:hypothetical protein
VVDCVSHKIRSIERAGSRALPAVERFWRHVQPGDLDECWEWTGSRDRHGYGRIGERINGKFYLRRAHRLSFEMHHGPVPDGLYVLHSCDRPCCVNPSHLRIGTQRENYEDSVARGRVRWHERREAA